MWSIAGFSTFPLLALFCASKFEYDPQIMIDRMVEVIAMDRHDFRAVLSGSGHAGLQRLSGETLGKESPTHGQLRPSLKIEDHAK